MTKAPCSQAPVEPSYTYGYCSYVFFWKIRCRARLITKTEKPGLKSTSKTWSSVYTKEVGKFEKLSYHVNVILVVLALFDFLSSLNLSMIRPPDRLQNGRSWQTFWIIQAAFVQIPDVAIVCDESFTHWYRVLSSGLLVSCFFNCRGDPQFSIIELASQMVAESGWTKLTWNKSS